MNAQAFKKGVADLNEHQLYLKKIRDEAKEKGFDLFAVVSNPKLQDGGSIYANTGKKDKSNAVWLARQNHMRWEKDNGISSTHDWEK